MNFGVIWEDCWVSVGLKTRYHPDGATVSSFQEDLSIHNQIHRHNIAGSLRQPCPEAADVVVA